MASVLRVRRKRAVRRSWQGPAKADPCEAYNIIAYMCVINKNIYIYIYIYIFIYLFVCFLPERQTGRCSLPTDKFHHAAGPATFAGAQGADSLGRRAGFYLRLAPTGGSSVPAPWSKPGPGHGNPIGPIAGARACHAQTGAATSGGRVSRHPGPIYIYIYIYIYIERERERCIYIHIYIYIYIIALTLLIITILITSHMNREIVY